MAITTYPSLSTGSYVTVDEMNANLGHIPTSLTYSGTSLVVGTHDPLKNLSLDMSQVDLTVKNLTVSGDTTTINSTTITVDDKNIELGSVASPTDSTANNGGITLKGATDKTFNWTSTGANWTSSENLSLANGKVYKINNTEVLSATTLGAGVTSSSLTSVGTLTPETWTINNSIEPDEISTGNGTQFVIAAGSTSKTHSQGGLLVLSGGEAIDGDGAGGKVSIIGGAADNGLGGEVSIKGGSTSSAIATRSGGEVNILGGNGGVGGDISIKPGSSSVATTAAKLELKGGDVTTDVSTGGTISITAGDSYPPNGDGFGGDVIIYAGSGRGFYGDNYGGDVYIDGGYSIAGGSNAPGKVYIGTQSTAFARTSVIEIGASTDTTTKLNGTVWLPNVGTDGIIHLEANGKIGYLADGADGKVLKMVSGSPAWADDTNTTYSGGTYITLDGTTFNHDTTTRGDGTSTLSPSHGGSFTVVDSVTTNTTGHVTAVNVKTVTLPSDNNTDTLQSISSSTTDAEYYITMVSAASGAQTGISNADIRANPSTGTISATNFNSTSDIRFKTDLEIIDNAVDKVMQLHGYTFTFKETGQRSAGLVTADVKNVLPEVVGGTAEKETLNYDGTIGLLVEAIKEQQAQIERLQAIIEKLVD